MILQATSGMAGGPDLVEAARAAALGVAGCLHAVARDVVMRRDKRVCRVTALHAQKPVLVLGALVGGILGPAHAGTRGPQEFFVKFVCVQRDSQKTAVPGARASQWRPSRPPLGAVGRPAQLKLARVLDKKVAEKGGRVLQPIRSNRLAGGGCGRWSTRQPGDQQPGGGQAENHCRRESLTDLSVG